jgi:hypothetical protein
MRFPTRRRCCCSARRAARRRLTRAQTASVVDRRAGEPYLVDCGYGTVRGLAQAGVRLPQSRMYS